MFVVAVAVVVAVVGEVLAQCDGSHDVEVEGELAVALAQEVVANRARAVVVRVAGLVEIVIVFGLGMLHLLVLVVDQNHEAFSFSRDRIGLGAPCSLALGAFGYSVCVACLHLGLQLALCLLQGYLLGDVLFVHYKGAAVCCLPVVIVLVTAQCGCHLGAVAQCQCALCAPGWHCTCSQGQHGQRDR